MTLLCAVQAPFPLNYDVSYPKSHVTLTLDAVTSFHCVQNVTNIPYVNFCGAVKSLAGLHVLQCNGGNVKETEGLK